MRLIFFIFLIQSVVCFGKPIEKKIPNPKSIEMLDEQERMILMQRSPTTLQKIDEDKHLAIYDLIQLSQAGINDDKIINYMNDKKSKYNLNKAQIYRMQNSGVSQRVINYTIDSGY